VRLPRLRAASEPNQTERTDKVPPAVSQTEIQSTPAIVPPLSTPLPVLPASKTSCTLLRFLLDFCLFCFTCPTLLQTLWDSRHIHYINGNLPR